MVECEIPTGALADAKSRRASIIIGYFLIGLGFAVEGALPYFATVAFAQLLWGLGYTFTRGATQAWIADEIGPTRAGEAYLRGAGDLRADAVAFAAALCTRQALLAALPPRQ